jgi:hypothetical protein
LGSDTGGNVCAAHINGAHATAATAVAMASFAAFSGRRRRDTCDLLAPKAHRAVRVASGACQPTLATCSDAERPGGCAGASRSKWPRNRRHEPPSGGPMVNGVKTDMVNARLIRIAAVAIGYRAVGNPDSRGRVTPSL